MRLRPFQVREYRGRWWYIGRQGIEVMGPYQTRAEAEAGASRARKRAGAEWGGGARSRGTSSRESGPGFAFGRDKEPRVQDSDKMKLCKPGPRVR